jgi:hypothetical protein
VAWTWVAVGASASPFFLLCFEGREQRILEAHQFAPHPIRTFRLSNDPKFAEKLKDIVGLYVDPPAHAVVLSVDEKSQIQAAIAPSQDCR